MYFILSIMSGVTGNINSTTAPSSIFRKLLNQQDYQRSDPPRLNETTVVRLGMYIAMIHGISEKTQDFSILFYLIQRWSDPRLQFSHFQSAPSKINLGQDAWETLWTPDVFFRNLKDGEYVDITVSNRQMRLHVTGEIFYIAAIKAVFTCPMEFQKYPFDTQICPIWLQSLSNEVDVVTLEWRPGSAVHLNPHVQLFSYTMNMITEEECSQNYTNGTFSCLSAKFTLQRRYGRLITQTYFPSVLMIILSWIPFWIDTSIDILVGMMIVMAFLMQTSTNDLPQISYITAVGIWFLVCVSYVFLALILYTIGQRLKGHQDNWVRKFKLWCRILLPVSFCIFCVVYFLVYTSIII